MLQSDTDAVLDLSIKIQLEYLLNTILKILGVRRHRAGP